jgi:hypothetical protein
MSRIASRAIDDGWLAAVAHATSAPQSWPTARAAGPARAAALRDQVTDVGGEQRQRV